MFFNDEIILTDKIGRALLRNTTCYMPHLILL